MKLVCGIDEAGRGPVIGPMVLAGAMLTESRFCELSAIGVRDSKLCTRAERESLYYAILKIVNRTHIVVVSPEEIDAAIFSEDSNLNSLEMAHQAAIVNALAPESVIIDCPEVNTDSYAMRLRRLLLCSSIEIRAECKADKNHPIVSAASILAKVTRDREIDGIKKRIGIDFGSGYPSDPKTRSFLESTQGEHWNIKRRSWKTLRREAEPG